MHYLDNALLGVRGLDKLQLGDVHYNLCIIIIWMNFFQPTDIHT